jgi:hypothetical protein
MAFARRSGDYGEAGQETIGKRDRRLEGNGAGPPWDSGQIFGAKAVKELAVWKTNFLLLTKNYPIKPIGGILR